MREALAIARENFDNFYMECAMMSVIVGTIGNDKPRNFKEAWWHTDQIKKEMEKGDQEGTLRYDNKRCMEKTCH